MPLGNDQYEAYKRAGTVMPPGILYKYTTVKTARTILSTRTLRFQSPLNYNDPFDSQWDPLWTAKTPEAMKYERSLIEQAVRDPKSWPANADPMHRQAMDTERTRIESLPEQERDQAITKFVQDAVSKPENYRWFDQWRHNFQRRLRVLCLCEDPCSDLMWAHYANEHRGVVLGFNIAVMEDHIMRPLEPVMYQDEPPQLVDYKEWFRSQVFGWNWKPDSDDVLRKLVLTKHSPWRYEREWRFALSAPQKALVDFMDIAFPAASLAELVTGFRTDKTEAAEMQALADVLQPNVCHFRMSKDQNQGTLVRSEWPGRRLAPPRFQ
jgi:hypothetical protein